jgi:hypothetical protein
MTSLKVLVLGVPLFFVACGSSASKGVDGDAAPSPSDQRDAGDGSGLADAGDAADSHDVPAAAIDADAGDAADSHDVASDAIDWNAPVACSAMTCGAGEICVREIGDADGAVEGFQCLAVPAACNGVPTCACVVPEVGCPFGCGAVSARQFSCPAGASADVFATCPTPRNIGCFMGAVCHSAQVDAVCASGSWRCPAGSTSTESCPSDGGADATD